MAKESPRGSLLSTEPDRHPTGPAAPHVALYSPQAGGTARMLVPRRAGKGCCCMHARASVPASDAFPKTE